MKQKTTKQQTSKELFTMKITRIILGLFILLVPIVVLLISVYLFNVDESIFIIFMIIIWLLFVPFAIFFSYEGFKLQKWIINEEGIQLTNKRYIDVLRLTMLPGKYSWKDIIYVISYPSQFSPMIINTIFIKSPTKENIIYGLQCRTQFRFDLDNLFKTKCNNKNLISFQSASEYQKWKKSSFKQGTRVIEIADINEGNFIPPI